MFDKVSITVNCSAAECVHLARIHSLREISVNGELVGYRSSSYKNITGISVDIEKNKKAPKPPQGALKKGINNSIAGVFKVKLSGSLHKYWNKITEGKLHNSDTFTISEAKMAFRELLLENGLLAGRVYITVCEIGVNLKVRQSPEVFISDFKRNCNRAMYIDANYAIGRQKTSEKTRNTRKYFKMYDKTWEMRDKERGKRSPKPNSELEDRDFKDSRDGERIIEGNAEGHYILRVETVHKRLKKRLDRFLTDENLHRYIVEFGADWQRLRFERQIKCLKGKRASEIDKAREILAADNRTEIVAARARADLAARRITQKQYRTVAEFCRDWQEHHSYDYREVVSLHETEFRQAFIEQYKVCRE
jgi:hypothetical protein